MTTHIGARRAQRFRTISKESRTVARPVDAELIRVNELPEIETVFVELDSARRVEIIESPADPSKTLLAFYEEGKIEIGERFEWGERVLVPEARNRVFGHIRLPKGAAPYKSVRSLFARTNQLLSACVDIDPMFLQLVCFFVLSSWFPEKVPVAPYLALIGTPRSGKTTLLRLLGLLCRHSVLVADVSSAGFYQAYEQTIPTLLIDETHTAADQKKLLHLLRSGSTPGFVALRKDSSLNCYGPKAFAWLEMPKDRALNTRCIMVPMHESERTDLKRPTNPDVLAKADELQKQFLQFRLDNYNGSAVANRSGVDGVDRLQSRERDLYESLAYPIAEDEQLCEVLASQIAMQRQFTREPLSIRQAAVLAVLAIAAHLPEQSVALVGEIARCANMVLSEQGEHLVLTPHAAGDVLTSLGIGRTCRTNKGWALEFDEELRRKIHLLIKRYEVDSSVLSVSGLSITCKICQGLELIDPKREIYGTDQIDFVART